jgi:hypothetical protein
MRIVVAVLLTCLPSLAAGQSLGEAARKEAERREKNKKAGVKAKSYTDQDLPSSGAKPPTGADGEPTAPPDTIPPAPASSEVEDESDSRAQAEAGWRERLADLTAQRDKAKAIHEELSKLWLVEGEQYVDDKGRVVIASLGDLRAKIARAKERWDAAEKAIADLHEEARRAGIPPGWLR